MESIYSKVYFNTSLGVFLRMIEEYQAYKKIVYFLNGENLTLGLYPEDDPENLGIQKMIQKS